MEPTLDVFSIVNQLLSDPRGPEGAAGDWVEVLPEDDARALLQDALVKLAMIKKSGTTPSKPSRALQIAAAPTNRQRKISKVGTRSTTGALLCPTCGGGQFKAKRSALGKMAAGALAPKTQVRCVTCGATFSRG